MTVLLIQCNLTSWQHKCHPFSCPKKDNILAQKRATFLPTRGELLAHKGRFNCPKRAIFLPKQGDIMPSNDDFLPKKRRFSCPERAIFLPKKGVFLAQKGEVS